MLSIIIPAYNEELNLPHLKERLDELIAKLNVNDIPSEVIFVDDHSSDGTSDIFKIICSQQKNYKYLRLSRNSGSHIAIISGFSFAQGDVAVFLASDLQDPPELVLQLIEKWKEGNDVVWAYRKNIEGVSFFRKINSKIFNFIFNKLTSLPTTFSGADFALIDRKVYQSVVSAAGSKPSLGALITWSGFKQTGIEYVKEKRKSGKSKWSLAKKINAFSDAFVGFSYFPLRFMSYLGIIVAALGFLYATLTISLKYIYNTQIQGWTSLMVVVLVLGGLQMLMLGVLGEYLWRNIEESRKRPLFFIEEKKGF